MPKLAANLSMMFTELPFEERFAAAAQTHQALDYAPVLRCPRLHVMAGLNGDHGTYAANLRWAKPWLG